jgi:CxxC-x17-CxxC domain-containing protein
LGALLITKLQLAAMSRIDTPEKDRTDFYLYIDEFQNFSTESFANIFAEARKYRLDLILAHQYIAQLNQTVKDAIFGNIGTLVTFRVGPEDAELLEKYFYPDFNKEDIINLPNYHFYIKLMIDGHLSKGFSGINIPPQNVPETSYVQEIIQNSRENYGTPKLEVEDQLKRWEMLDFSQEEEKEKIIRKPQIGVQEGWRTFCSNCGKPIIVPFRPDPNRPVYCEDCLKEMQRVKKQLPDYSQKDSQYRKPKPPPQAEEIKNLLKDINQE